MNHLRRRRLPLLHLAADCGAWAVAVFVSWWVRFDLELDPIRFESVALVIACAVVCQFLLGSLFGLYLGRWRYGSFDEVIAVGMSYVSTGLVLTAISWSVGAIPDSVAITATGLALMIAVAGRSAWRLFRSRNVAPVDATPVVVVGAGEAGAQIISAMLSDARSTYRPVALVDDDPAKANLRINGVRVLGTIDELAGVAERVGADTALLAIPSAPQALRSHLSQLAGLTILTLPSVSEMLTDTGEAVPALTHIQPITEEELLGRPPSQIDTDAVASYITGRRVLVTGAGGSIGSELCRQLARFAPEALYMLDRDESGLHATQLSIEGRALLDSPALVLADLRDPERMAEVFDTCRPHVVFHAAALKHLTLLEHSPAEAWKTNVVGTQQVIELCELYGVERFVNISTDKAADPSCVLGYTKRIAERLTASAARHKSDSIYLSVRFGNVLGSRGSVLTAFDAQSLTGGPITVTDAEVTRYFMTIEEASRLTIYAGAIGRPGEALVLDMGEPVRIVDVAQRFANRHTPPLEIVFTGLRPGEKLHEVLLGVEETDERPVHELISHVCVPPLAWRDCQAFVAAEPDHSAVDAAMLARLAGSVALRPAVAAS